MKKHLIIIILAYSTTITAQDSVWFEDCNKTLKYSQDEYLIGSARDYDNNQGNTDVINRLKIASMINLANSISSQIKNTTIYYLEGKTIYNNESIKKMLKSNTITTVDLELLGIQFDTCTNPISNIITSYCYIKKSDFKKKLHNIITLDIAQIENKLDNIEFLIDKGYKIDAKNNANNYQNTFDSLLTEITRYYSILCRIDNSLTEDQIKSDVDKISNAVNHYTNLKALLAKGLSIYFSCKADVFGVENDIFCDKLRSEINNLHFNIVDSIVQADWIIEIATFAKEDSKYQPKNNGIINYETEVFAKIKISQRSVSQYTKYHIISQKAQSQGYSTDTAEKKYSDAAYKVYKDKTFIDDILKCIKIDIEL